MVMVTSLNFISRDILKCLGSKRPTSTEESKDHSLGQSSLKMLSLKTNISHSPVRTDVLREVVYHNNLIAASHQKYLENVIARCHIVLSKGDSNITEQERS